MSAQPPEGADDVGRSDEPGDAPTEGYTKKGKLKAAVYDHEMDDCTRNS